MRSGANTPKPKSSLGAQIITQAIAVTVFVLLPIVITLMVPLSTVRFQHVESQVQVDVVRYMLIAIPWKTERVSNATGARADITAEKHYRGTSEERRKGQSGVSVATGQVAFLHDGPEVIVQAAPELATDIVKEFDQFAANRAALPVSIDVFASWGLSYILGGIMTGLCALYVFGAVVSILRLPFQRTRTEEPGHTGA